MLVIMVPAPILIIFIKKIFLRSPQSWLPAPYACTEPLWTDAHES